MHEVELRWHYMKDHVQCMNWNEDGITWEKMEAMTIKHEVTEMKMTLKTNDIKWKYDNARSEMKRSLHEIMKGNDNAWSEMKIVLNEIKWKYDNARSEICGNKMNRSL